MADDCFLDGSFCPNYHFIFDLTNDNGIPKELTSRLLMILKILQFGCEI